MMGSEASQPEPRGTRRRWRVAGTTFSLLLLGVLGVVLAQRWQELPAGFLEPDWPRVALALAGLLGSTAVSALQWRQTLGRLGHRLSRTEALYIHFVSQAAKYLPGRILLVVGKVLLATRQGLPVQGVTASVVYEQALFVLSGAFSALILAGFASVDLVDRSRLEVWLLCLAGFALLHPIVMRQMFRVMQWASRSESSVPPLAYGVALRLLLGYCIPWLMTGCAFYLLVTALAPLELRALPDMAAVVAISALLGLVSLVAPAGLGVREAALAGLLSAYFSVSVAIAIAIAFRLLATVVDGLALLVGLALQPACRRRAAEVAANAG